MANEKILEKKLNLAVKKAGGKSIKLLPFLEAGLPDRMVLMPLGRIYYVEMKSTGKKQTPLQKNVMASLTKLGFDCWVIDTEELLTNFLKAIRI